MVRGKYIMSEFVSTHTVMSSKDDFVTAVLARQPKLAAVTELGVLLESATLKALH
ncbi:hypothetical protein [Tsukamurella pseudospumae]|uniref:hypothetical protein n=1 Tax=Tsukamurella pseudospumae TaxID=239498 RepID=UPI000A588366|nr:hypothetical protein [Tsukamurella pseudospumae]